ncbi:MAG: threonine synthase, partial [Pseudobutyrivibrio sp.]|nr:threonine synthase [Pseudobutyrivibrio sp.]
GDDAAKNADLMESLKTEGKYEITADMRAKLDTFCGGYSSEKQTGETIKKLYQDTGYVIDTHTAVAAGVYNAYKAKTGDDTPTVIASTASPFKFTRAVMGAIDSAYNDSEDFVLVDKLSELGKVAVPNAIEEIRTAPVLHDTVVEVSDMCAEVKRFLGL